MGKGGVSIDISEDVQKGIFKILKERAIAPIIGAYDYALVVKNDTGKTLRRVGTHNASEAWPIEDLKEGSNAGGLRCKSFSFAVKYTDGKTFYMLGASSPLWGKNKIGLKKGDGDLKKFWDEMDDNSDKSADKCRAMLTNADNKPTWVFLLE